MPSAEQVVQEFCAAASTRDPQVLRAFFSDDIVCEEGPQYVGIPRARRGAEVPHNLFGAGHRHSSLADRATHASKRSGMMTT